MNIKELLWIFNDFCWWISDLYTIYAQVRSCTKSLDENGSWIEVKCKKPWCLTLRNSEATLQISQVVLLYPTPQARFKALLHFLIAYITECGFVISTNQATISHKWSHPLDLGTEGTMHITQHHLQSRF